MAKPSIRELLDKVREAFDREEVVAGLEMQLVARVERVLELHGRSVNIRDGKPYEYCPECGGVDSPCPTVRALEGEE